MATVSIVIPTRNRGKILANAIRTALAQSHQDLELIVSNNHSEDETRTVAQSFDDRRLRYFETPSTLSMPDSWEFALSRAQGEWVTVLEDDNGLLPRAVEKALSAAIRHEADVVAWPHMSTYYPRDVPEAYKRNAYVHFKGANGATSFYVPSEKGLSSLFDIRREPVPKMLNALVHRNLIAKVTERLGRFFLPPAPDYTSCVAILALSPGYAIVDAPLHLSAGVTTSPGKSPESFRSFLEEFGDDYPDGFLPIPMTALGPHNVIAESLCRAKAALGDELAGYDLNRRRFLERAYLVMMRFEALGFRFGKDKAIVRDLLWAQPLPDRLRTVARIARGVSSSQVAALARRTAQHFPRVGISMAKLGGKSLVRGDDAGFEDLVGAAAHLDRMLFGAR